MSMTNPSVDPILQDELLAKAHGTLPPEEEARVQAALDADDQLAADFALMVGLRTALHDAPATQSPPSEFGWKRLEAAIDRDAAQQAKPTGSGRWWQYAAAGLACVCVLQGLALMRGFEGQQDGFQTASLVAFENVLAVRFTPETTEPQLRGLLTDIGTQIVDGPSGSAIYRIAFDTPEALAAAIDVLSESPIIALVAQE